MWLKTFFEEIEILAPKHIHMNCDGQVAISIIANPVLQKRNKNIEIACHFICDGGIAHPANIHNIHFYYKPVGRWIIH